MDDKELVKRIKEFASQSSAPLRPPATKEEIAAAESRLGFSLHPFHALLLTSVANGGFGPGDGLLGVGERGHHAKAHGDLAGVRAAIGSTHPPGAVPLNDFRDGYWGVVDKNAAFYISTDHGVFQMRKDLDLRRLLSAWASGEDLEEWLFKPASPARTAINPMTKEEIAMPAKPRAPKGVPIRGW
jgi:hypothetical protein